MVAFPREGDDRGTAAGEIERGAADRGVVVPRFAASAAPGILWPGVPDPLNARVFAFCYQLRASQWWPATRLLERQLAQARALIEHARATVPLYRGDAYADSEAVSASYEAFRRLPILTRRQVQDAGEALRSAQLPAGHGPAHVAETSGSTGMPVRLQETLVTRAMLKAMNLRLAAWHGLDHAEKLVAIRRVSAVPPGREAQWGNGYESGPLVLFDATEPLERLLDRLTAEGASYVATYPSLARELARRCGEGARRLPGLRAVLTFGGVLDSVTREECGRLLGVPVIDNYSAIEAGVLAIQCPLGEHCHVASESVLLEVLDDAGRPCAPGEVGRVIVTPLHNFATPLIRYELGDYAEVGAGCACGRGLPVLRRILGRVRNLMVVPGGERRWPFASSMKFATIGGLRQFQIAQTALDTLEARLVLARPWTSVEEDAFRRALLDAVGHPFRVVLRFFTAIARGPGGKFEDFVCELDRPAAAAIDIRGGADTGETEPRHRLRADARWSLWRDVVLRAAGFPVRLLDRLANAELARAADLMLAAGDVYEAALADSKRICYERLADPGAAGRAALRQAMRRLKQRRPEAARSDDPALRGSIETARRALAALERARGEYERAVRGATSATAAALREIAADNRFREAVAWQNHHALSNGIDPVAQRTERDVKPGQSSLVARYLQRYAAKNDTIGFFGAAAWARIDGVVPLVIEPGASIAADALVEFEPWALRALAAAIPADDALRPWLAPRRHPAARREEADTVVHLDRRVRLGAREVAVLDACDGSTPARDIAEHLAARNPSLFGSGAEVLDTLGSLAAAGLVVWGIDVPLVASPEEGLRAEFDRLPPGAPRNRCHAALAGLVELKSEAQRAVGSAGAVAAAMERLDERFRALTGRAPKRLHGRTYAGRTLVYLDARRDVECRIGEDLALELARALRPVLAAASWYARQFHAQLTDFAEGIHERLCRARGRGNAVPLDLFWHELRCSVATVEAIREDVAEQLAERWARVIPLPGNAREVRHESAGLMPAVAAAFADAPAGWSASRFQAPDVMLAAQSVEAVAEGRYCFVLGELHPASRSLLQQLFAARHPQPERLAQAARGDHPEPLLRVAARGEAASLRAALPPDAELDFEIECDEARSALPRERVLALSELEIERANEGLRIRTRDGRRAFPASAFLGPQGAAFLRPGFTLFPRATHLPRVRIDRLVVQREAWRVPAAEFAFARLARAADRYLEARRFARALALPRRLFYRVPRERKPLYLDLESPAYVELFCGLVRRSGTASGATVELTEMLPVPEEAWLADAAGERYTSELRLLFIDRGLEGAARR